MKIVKPFCGILLIITGALVLATTRLLPMDWHNRLLTVGLLCILVGAWLHVRIIKHENNS